MFDFINISHAIIESLGQNLDSLFIFLPVFILIELPLVIMGYLGLMHWAWRKKPVQLKRTPSISFVITCYGEGRDILQTIDTLIEQVYPGDIEVLPVVDGAIQNKDTYQAALEGARKHQGKILRRVRVIPKWQRGGRVSTLNAGLAAARNEIVINVDGDTSFDNDMLLHMINEFQDENVMASGGALRVRNDKVNLLTRMQSLEYMISMQANKTGMSELGLLNNISGAFGAFRKETLKRVGGWDTHTAEDLDLTMRLKQYKTRNPEKKIVFTPLAVGHTDVPVTLKDLTLQRLRWDGDLLFLYLRKHKKGLTPALLGWKTFLYTLIYGVIQNTLLPILVLIFTLYFLFAYPFYLLLSVLFVLYLLYLSFFLLNYIVYLVLISERPRQDIKLCGWVFLYPFYTYMLRFITAFSVINEIVRRSHEESTMAPWWVLKRGNKF
ncbi:glycosyltransferase family 2 protein [Psychromonas hadalis]|uniref:glycosyltransferase family 2 protein n=1 Tax=Psychromonas hadalis TaxID=211669 RepID=UPI0003B6D2E2|nr:glycosyltransferase [Psychromonas hadalis]